MGSFGVLKRDTSSPSISSLRVRLRARAGLSTGMQMSCASFSGSGKIFSMTTRSTPRSTVSNSISSSFSNCSTNSMKALLPITSTRSRKVGLPSWPRNIRRRPRPMVCSGRMLALARIGPQADNHGDTLHVPPFAQHQHADDGIDRAACRSRSPEQPCAPSSRSPLATSPARSV